MIAGADRRTKTGDRYSFVRPNATYSPQEDLTTGLGGCCEEMDSDRIELLFSRIGILGLGTQEGPERADSQHRFRLRRYLVGSEQEG